MEKPSQKGTERSYSEEERQQRKDFIAYLHSIKESVENGNFMPSKDWETIWVLSGPEHDFDENSASSAEDGLVNQTKERVETGIEILKAVTVLRTEKKEEELTREDYLNFAPTLYYNGGEGRSDAFREMVHSGYIENKYDIPPGVIRISENDPDILHTGHQFDEYPEDLLNKGKTVVVSSWYHTPRVQEYVEKKSESDSLPNLSEKMLVYPANLERLRIGRAVGEAKKVWDYFRKDPV